MTRVPLCLVLGVLAAPLAAQDTTAAAGTAGGFSVPVRFSGEVGTYGELYRASGVDARRPSATGRLYLESEVQLFGRVTMGLDLLLSSEEGAGLSGTPGLSRQRLNRLGLSPRWDWGRAFVGSFTDTYSTYTLSGLRLTGAGFNVTPGPLRLATAAGLTQSAVLGGATDGGYSRRLVGGRVGVGGDATERSGSFVDVIFLRVWDDPNSLPITSDPIEPTAGIPVTTLAVTPEENVVVGTAFGADLFSRRLRLGGEITAAIHSRDRRAPELDEETLPSYPGILRGLLTPRVSTHADYAMRFETTVRIPRLPGGSPSSPRSAEIGGEYSYIGPGYVSLGTASLPADQRAFGLQSAVRFRQWRLSLQGRHHRDNLIGQKLATTTRVQLAGNFTLRVTSRWTATLRGSVLDMGNDSDDELRRIAYATRSFGSTHTYAFGPRQLLRSVTLGYGYQDAGDENPARAAGNLVSHNADVRVALSPSRAVQISPSVGIVRSRQGEAGWGTRESYALAATFRTLEGRWTTTTAVGTSRATPSRALRASVSSQFRLTEEHTLALQLRSNRVTSALDDVSDFTEYVMTFQMTRRLR